jgi:hypothetical protein
MQRKFVSLGSLAIGVCALALSALPVQAQDKVDANGTWTWAAPAGGRGRNGGGGGGADTSAPPRVNTLKLKVEGDKVTGTLTPPAGRNGAATDQAISDGKIMGSQISFNIVREGRNGGPSMTNKYEGKISGDTITGTQTGGAGGRGRRNGGGGGDTSATPPPAPTPMPWEAKRSK